MKIKASKKPSSVWSNIRVMFHQKRALPIFFLGLGSLSLLSLLFLLTLNYGTYLKKIEQTTYIKQAMVEVSQLDFSFIENYADSRFAEFDEMKIDIKFKHLLRLEYLRKQSLEEKYILDKFKQEEFPATLSFKGETHQVKVSMTGKVAQGHLGNPSKWSFQVKVKGNDTVNGMKRFGLLIPESRGFLTDWIALKLLEERDLIRLRSDFVNVSINGKTRGIFYLEERFDKHLIENNHLREGIIFKIEEDLSPYKEAKLMLNPDTRAQLLLVKRMWQDVMAGNLPANQFFDLKKMAKLFVIIDLMNEKHPLIRENLRFYFNPVTNLAEPIAREFKNLDNSRPPPLALFLEEPTGDSRHFRLTRDKVNQLIYDDLEFKRYYLQEAELLSQEKFLDDFFSRNGDKINTLLGKLYRTWPFYDLPSKKLYRHQEYMRSVLSPDTDQVKAHYIQHDQDQVFVELQNQQYLPLEVSYLSWRDSLFFYPKQPIELDSKAKTSEKEPKIFSFQLPKGLSWQNNIVSELKVHYHLLGLQSWEKTTSLSSQMGLITQPYFNHSSEIKANYKEFTFIKEKENELSIPAGKWSISQDLVIPKNKRLQIEAGAEIDLLKQAKIISYSPISSQGQKNKPVIIGSSDASGEGLIVIGAEHRSSFSYTHIQELASHHDINQPLIGSIVFYESPVTFTSCTFSNKPVAGKSLHIIQSHFSIEQTQFTNIASTAFDCNNCKGSIQNTSFLNIGRNGINISGTAAAVEMDQVFMDQIEVQAISTSDNSKLDAYWLEIRNAGIGIMSQDQSETSLSDVTLVNTKIGLTTFQNKPEFGPARMSATRIEIEQSQLPYLVEKGSHLIINGKSISPNREKVKELLYTSDPGSLSYQ